MTSVSLDAVTTTDADPGAAPHKISAKPGESAVEVKFTPQASGPIRAWRIIFNSTARNAGRLVANLGCVCGLNRCGAPGVMPLAAAPGVQRTETITYDETGAPGDGDYTVSVHAVADEGWNA